MIIAQFKNYYHYDYWLTTLKIMIHETKILPTLLYECETLSLTPWTEKNQAVQE
jgi:hypothetical protein